MFIEKDLRKIPTILSDATKASNNRGDNNVVENDKKKKKRNNDDDNSSSSSSSKLLDLRLQRRKAEFKGSVKILCQPENAPALDHLQCLSLYDCGVSTLDGIGMLSTLETLNVGRNPLEHVPDELSTGCTSLKEIWLDDCAFTGSLPVAVLKCQALEELRISNNKLTHIPSEIRNLSKLRVLGLDNNQFKSLPSDLECMNNLETLLVRQNQLQELPDGIFDNSKISNLKVLHASSNQLVRVPVSVKGCKSLTHLYLNSNLLKSLPNGMEKMTLQGYSMKRLNISHNQIDYLPAAFFHTFGEPDANGLCTKMDNCQIMMLENPVCKQKKPLLQINAEDDEPMDTSSSS